MKILIIHGDPRPPGQGGGAESLLRDQAHGLKTLGHEVSWWNGRGELSEAIDTFQPDICHVMTIHCYPMGMFPLVYLQENNIPHMIHLQDYWPFCDGRMLLKNSDQSCAAVRGICDGDCQCRPVPAHYREIVNKSFIVAGNAYTGEIYKRNGLRCDAVVELGIDTELFRPDSSKRDADVSIYTSTAWPDQPVKGMHILRQAINGTGIDVKLVTGLPREKVAETLQRAHVFVFPSCYEETFGLCLCEAMASGCACIASDVAGARAQIDDHVTGLLVPPRDPQALREAIVWMLGHKSLRESMGFVARAHVEKLHTLQAMSERWVSVYNRVLEAR